MRLHRAALTDMVNHMVQYSTARLDASFAALADATRRGVLDQLGRRDASISDLARTFKMTLTGMKKHVGVLEQAGLVSTEKVGRVRTCSIETSGLRLAEQWLEQRRSLWERRFDRLGALLDEAEDEDAGLDSPPSPPSKRRKS